MHVEKMESTIHQIIDGPLFNSPIELDITGKTFSNGYGILDIN